jgi:hypothetical protein
MSKSKTTNTNTNTNKNTNKIVVNVNTKGCCDTKKKKTKPKSRASDNKEPAPMMTPAPIPTHDVYHPIQSLISSPNSVGLPDYFQTAATNRDLSMTALNMAAMMRDMQDTYRQAYGMGAMPGAGAGVPPPFSERPPTPSMPSTPSAASTTPSSVNTGAMSVDSAPFQREAEAQASTSAGGQGENNDLAYIADLQLRYRAASNAQKLKFKGEVLYLAQQYGVSTTNKDGEVMYAGDLLNRIVKHLRRQQ